jgi:lipoate-protein ligase A
MPRTPRCRLLSYTIADGPHNMAADEALLESAATGSATLRFYGWSEATLSLGYFQPTTLHEVNDPQGGLLLASLPFVRRPSGGAALVHHHEVTYDLALPAGPPWQTGDSWLCRMHDVIAAALATLGVEANACACTTEPRFTGVLCFKHLTAGDLLLGPSKVVGSAQRRQRGALLQHGAILLAASPHATVLPGIRELTGRALTAEETCAAVAREFDRGTGWDLAPGDWTPDERERTVVLATTKYSQDAWNRKR